MTVQVPVPEQPPPLQPVNVEPAAGVAVSVTEVPLAKAAKAAAQEVSQAMPAGALAIVPAPAPVLLTARAKFCRAKVAVTL